MKINDTIKQTLIVVLSVLWIIILPTKILLTSKAEASNSYSYFVPTVIKVVDGDTIKVNFSALNNYPPLNEVSIRLRGIDTPESYRPKCEKERELGLKAKQFVVDLISEGSRIRVSDYEWGKYGGRIVGDVSTKGKDIATELVNAGLAVRYDGGTKTHSWCQ